MPSGGDHRTLTSLSQCAICFSVITTDMQPRQCSGCRNSLYCGNCVSQYANQCPVCKDSQVQFIPIHTQLRKILDSIRFRCRRSNGSAACTAETEGRNFRINQHNYIECPLLEDTGFDQNREFTIQTVRDKDQKLIGVVNFSLDWQSGKTVLKEKKVMQFQKCIDPQASITISAKLLDIPKDELLDQSSTKVSIVPSSAKR